MSRLVNEVGNRYGKLVIVSRVGANKFGFATWEARCDCGATKIVSGHNLRNMGFSNPGMKGCGCTKQTTHGHSVHGHRSPTWWSWCAMKARCLYPGDRNWKNYGGKGVKVCLRWRDKGGFANFLSDMGERPIGTTLGRFGDTGDYDVWNCKWMTRAEQEAEKRMKRAA